MYIYDVLLLPVETNETCCFLCEKEGEAQGIFV
jgi:hypothetical protein